MTVPSILAEITSQSVGVVPLLHDHHTKTVDIGCNGSTVSCGVLGDILQLGCYHPIHGMVVACPFAQFDGTRFYDAEYVRDYRQKILEYVRSGTRGFGIKFKGHITSLNVDFLHNQSILVTYSIGDVRVSTTVSVNETGEVQQTTILTSASSKLAHIDYTLDLCLSVNRASYGQLTEGGPIPIPPSENDFRLFDSGTTWAITNGNLDAMIEGCLYINNQPISLNTDLSDGIFRGKPTNTTHSDRLQLHPQQQIILVSTFKLHSGVESLRLPSCSSSIPPRLKSGWKLANDERGMIIRRNLEYILGNCALPVGEDAVCLITDHVALPLGWNRDNYWQIRFLLDIYRNLATITYPATAHTYATRIHDTVKGHLKWVFQLAQRPHGYWHRSYLATGIPKDGPVFQLDQQCYPLLELCDFNKEFPHERDFVGTILGNQEMTHILQMLENHRDKSTGLYLTEETPGDDEVEHPYHFSSQVLLWHTYRRLSLLLETFLEITSLQSVELENRAALIKQATATHFIARNPDCRETLFAYLTDGAGNHNFYHDANDIPTLFALDWGFVNTPALKMVWTQTMKFALSPLNDGGYYAEGKFGGLGSVHTKGPWPLGYAQEYVYAHLTENEIKQEDAWRRIKGSMFWDGLFPEAVDCHTGDCVSKAWFSWPGSMIGIALLRFDLKEGMRSLI